MFQPDSSSATDASAIEFPEIKVRRTALPNGLTLLTKCDRSAPVASVQAWCSVGSIHEDEWLGAGLSHILEHMLFKGTETRTTGEIAETVQDSGGYMNAYTSFDRTVYWIDCPSEGVEISVDVLADVMLNASIPAEEYEKEMEVIRREFAMGFDDPDRMSSQQMFETSFQTHPYGIPVIGHLDIFNRLTRDDVMAYYKRHYVPNNMTVVVVGDIDEDAVIAQVKELYGKRERGILKPVYIPQEPTQLGRREDHQEFETQLTRLTMAWRIPDVTHADMPALDVLSTILGEGRSSRLYRDIREDKKLVHSVDAYSYTPAHGGLFAVCADLDPEKRAATQQAVFDLIAQIQTEGVTDAEVEKSCRMTLSAQIGGLTTMRGQASDIGGNWQLTRNVNFTRDYMLAVQKVTPADVMDVAQRYFIERTLSITTLNPPGTLSTSDGATGAVNDNQIQKIELDCGLTLLIREDHRLPLVYMGATFRGGLLAEEDDTSGLTSFFTRTIMKGTETRSAKEISGSIESVGGRIGASSGNNSFSISAKVMRPDTVMAIDVLSDVILNPVFPTESVEREREVQLASIQEEAERPMTVASKTLRSAMFADHAFARSRGGTEESLKSITREHLVAFHKQYVTRGNCVLSFFGDVRVDEIKKLVEEKLSAMPLGERPFNDQVDAPALTESLHLSETLNKQQAVIVVGYRMGGIDSEDGDAIDLLDEACSDMASRFFIRIREELGLAYYVGTTQVLGMKMGGFIFYVGTSPEKVDLVERELLDEIEKLAKDGLTEVELNRAKKTYAGKQKIEMQSNGAVAQMAALDELHGLGFENYKESLEKVESLTVEDIKALTNRYLLDKPRVIVRVMPDANAVIEEDSEEEVEDEEDDFDLD
jgi:zinc protease